MARIAASFALLSLLLPLASATGKSSEKKFQERIR